MAVYQELEDFDEMFEMADKDTILLVNDLDPELTEDRDLLIDQMVTRHEGDSLSVIPTCFCGETIGASKTGQYCPECGTPVEQSTERTIESTLWMKAPDETPGFIHPTLYII